MNDKIRSQHLARKAMVYVRQSSAYQVSHNVESQKLQYAMQERLHQLGWHEIEVVDEDLGCSAAGTQTRTGFERMVAEVCLGRVGAVAAREVSRFARNSREWQQLVSSSRFVGWSIPYSSIKKRSTPRGKGRKVAPRGHPIPNPIEVILEVPLELLKRFLIHPGRPSVGFNQQVCPPTPAALEFQTALLHSVGSSHRWLTSNSAG